MSETVSTHPDQTLSLGVGKKIFKEFHLPETLTQELYTCDCSHLFMPIMHSVCHTTDLCTEEETLIFLKKSTFQQEPNDMSYHTTRRGHLKPCGDNGIDLRSSINSLLYREYQYTETNKRDREIEIERWRDILQLVVPKQKKSNPRPKTRTLDP